MPHSTNAKCSPGRLPKLTCRTVWTLSFIILVGSYGLGNRAQAELTLSIQPLPANTLPIDIVAETRQAVTDGLNDGLVALSAPNGDIKSAWYSDPTDRYSHGILGDAIEAGTINVITTDDREMSVTLPSTQVFEDRYPRLSDLNNDGRTEVITIRSSVSEGASVTIYGLRDNELVQIATTEFIGLANRWLNIAGVESFRGRSTREIAYVETPHIGGTLYFLALAGNRLETVASAYGFSNHVIGSREMRLSTALDANTDGTIDLALPSANRQSLRIVGFVKEQLTQLGSITLPRRINKAIGRNTQNGDDQLLIGLDDDSQVTVRLIQQ